MSERKITDGSLIQDYVKFRWSEESDDRVSYNIEARISPELKERIDILGFDADKLLDAEPEHVLTKLEMLELEARREDARIKSSVVQAKEREKLESVNDKQ